MLVLVTSRYDEHARALTTLWRAHDASLLTSDDLSVSGWRHYPGRPERSQAVIGGRTVPVSEITGVLTLWPWILDNELTHISPAERAYTASEMNAFLVAWLSDLRCPVLNRPSPTCLTGPSWRTEHWVARAAALGIPVRPLRRRVAPENDDCAPGPTGVTVTVIGGRCIGPVAARVARSAIVLAELAEVALLTLRFSSGDAGALFEGAEVRPDLSQPGVADGVYEYFRQAGGKHGISLGYSVRPATSLGRQSAG